MKKSENFIPNLKFEYNNISFIEQALLSNSALKCMYAIRSCVVNNFRTNKIIDSLRRLKTSDLIEWNSCKISNCAYAALHLLEIEAYNGNDTQVQDLIDTVFYTK